MIELLLKIYCCLDGVSQGGNPSLSWCGEEPAKKSLALCDEEIFDVVGDEKYTDWRAHWRWREPQSMQSNGDGGEDVVAKKN